MQRSLSREEEVVSNLAAKDTTLHQKGLLNTICLQTVVTICSKKSIELTFL